ncbi:hypothetical protein ABPG77_006731 [Micractinium sp. CCAP 211/92]
MQGPSGPGDPALQASMQGRQQGSGLPPAAAQPPQLTQQQPQSQLSQLDLTALLQLHNATGGAGGPAAALGAGNNDVANLVQALGLLGGAAAGVLGPASGLGAAHALPQQPAATAPPPLQPSAQLAQAQPGGLNSLLAGLGGLPGAFSSFGGLPGGLAGLPGGLAGLPASSGLFNVPSANSATLPPLGSAFLAPPPPLPQASALQQRLNRQMQQQPPAQQQNSEQAQLALALQQLMAGMPPQQPQQPQQAQQAAPTPAAQNDSELLASLQQLTELVHLPQQVAQRQPPPQPQQAPHQAAAGAAAAPLPTDATAQLLSGVNELRNAAEAATGRSRARRQRTASDGKAAATEPPAAAPPPAAASVLPAAGSLPPSALPAAASLPPGLQSLLGQPRQQASSRKRAASMDEHDSLRIEAANGDDEEKLAEARRKNREAQQRFRERQRAAVREAEAQYNEVVAEVAKLQIENKELQDRNHVMSSVLGVRDAMLQAFSLGQAAGQPSGIAGPAAAGGEPAGEQPEAQQQEQPMQVDSPPPPEQGQQQPPEGKQEQQEQVQEQAAGQQALPGRAAEEGGAAGADAAAEAGNGAGEAVSLRAGTSMGGSRANGSVGGGSSSQIEEVQPASHGAINNPAALKLACDMTSHEDFTAYYQQVQVELRFAVQMWLENGLADEDRAAVESAHRALQDVWANVVRLYPNHFKAFIKDMCPPDGTELDRWEAFAAKMDTPQMALPEENLHNVFKAYRRYLKQGARIAQERQHAQHQLAAVSEAVEKRAASLENGGSDLSMQAMSQHLLEALELTHMLHGLAEEEYHIRLELVTAWAYSCEHFNLGVLDADSAPYIANWCEVVRRTLRRAAQSGRLLSASGEPLSAEELQDLMLSPDQEDGPACRGAAPRRIQALDGPGADCGKGPGSGPAMVPTPGSEADPRAPAHEPSAAAAAEGGAA